MRALIVALALLVVACAESTIPMLRQRPIPRPPEPAEDPYRPAEGSLWRGDSSRRFLAFENRAKRVGDLVTVLIEEKATAESDAKTQLSRKSGFDANLDSDLSLQTLATRPILRVLNFLGFSRQREDHLPTTNVEIIDAETETSYEGEGSVEREATFTTKIACVVTDVSGAGLLLLEGERRLKINNETQIIRLRGYVRPEDIRLDNTVPSALVANAEIEYGGRGAMAEKQREPIISRLLGMILPF